jgi:DNA replication protein DnaC
MNSSYQQLIQNLEYLKLKHMICHLSETIDFSTKNQLSFVDTLVKLTNYEIDMRERNMINSIVKVGAFPHLKELKDFDFDFQPSINKQQILDFTTLRFIEENENIVF